MKIIGDLFIMYKINDTHDQTTVAVTEVCAYL